jgi:hypothetical protein
VLIEFPTRARSRKGENLEQKGTFGEALRRKATPAAVVVAAICTLGLAFNTWMIVLNRDAFGIDFNQYYSASRLAGTGHLYDWDALRKIEVEHGVEVPTGRLPVVLYGHKILGSLPYAVARAIWLAGCILAMVLFAALWPGTRRVTMMVALACSMTAASELLILQDVPFWLLFFSGGLWLMEKKRPWSAGMVFALCICKFHLALGIPVMLAAQKRWKTLIAGTIAGVALIASCFLIEGPSWPLQYAKYSQMPKFSPAPWRMPNLHGLAWWLPWPTAFEIVFVVAIVWLLWMACRGRTDVGTAGAAAAACGLLLGYHGYAYDCVFLIPLSVLTIQRPGAPSWLKAWAVVLLSPVPVLLLTSEKPLLGQILVVAFIVTAILFGMARPLSQAGEMAAGSASTASPKLAEA